MRRQMRYLIHRYPWIALYSGSVAYELQLGPLSFFWVYPECRHFVFAGGRRLLVQHEGYWWTTQWRRLKRRMRRAGVFLAQSLEHLYLGF